MFLQDKYTPDNINNVFFHKQLYNLLELLSNDEAIPNIIFYGPSGSGKRTMIKIFLEMLFDNTVHNVKNTKYNVSGSGNKVTEENIKQSNYHIVLEPKGNNYDRYLIHDVVKVYAQRMSLGIFKTNRKFKIVVINNIDNLSTNAQFSLRRTMEDNSNNCRFIFWSTSISKVINPLKSRCKCIRVPAPSNKDIINYIMTISYKENIKLSLDELSKIIHESNGNIKIALWILQMFSNNEKTINKIIDNIDKLSNIVNMLNDKINIKNIVSKELTKIEVFQEITKEIKNVSGITYFNDLDKIKKMCEKIFEPLQKILEILYDKEEIFLDYESFIKNYSKKIGKNISRKIDVSKIEDHIDILKTTLNIIISSLYTLDSNTNKKYKIDKLTEYILTKNINTIYNIRNIIFDLTMTNIQPSNIIMLITCNLLDKESISYDKKVKISKITSHIDHNMINGRRDIIHFDNYIISIMNIL